MEYESRRQYMQKVQKQTNTNFIQNEILIRRRIILRFSFMFEVLAILYVLVFIIVIDEDDFVDRVGNGIRYLTHVIFVRVV